MTETVPELLDMRAAMEQNARAATEWFARWEEAATALEAAQARIEALEAAIQAFADFDAMPTQAKRPDVFEIRVRQPLLRALMEKPNENG